MVTLAGRRDHTDGGVLIILTGHRELMSGHTINDISLFVRT